MRTVILDHTTFDHTTFIALSNAPPISDVLIETDDGESHVVPVIRIWWGGGDLEFEDDDATDTVTVKFNKKPVKRIRICS